MLSIVIGSLLLILCLEACIVSFLLGKETEKREGCSGCCIFQVMIIEQLKTIK